jgi:hypothetical protein
LANFIEKCKADLKKELTWIESSSHGIGSRIKILQREAESLKIELLKYSLEKQRKEHGLHWKA